MKILKRVAAIALGIIVGGSVIVPASGNAKIAFKDIRGHWAENIVNEAVANYVMKGNPDGTFKPDNFITREEFFSAVTNIMTDTPDISNVNLPFSDVKSYEWYVKAIKIAFASGLTNGLGDGTFGIGKNITREEAAKIVSGIVPTNDLSGAGYKLAKDAGEVSDWAIKGVDIMYKKGYMRGDEFGFLRPKSPLTRAAAAKILLEVKRSEKNISGSADKVVSGEFTKGDGTQANPYQITNAAQLNNVRKFIGKKAYFMLKNDIVVDADFAKVVPMTKIGNKEMEDVQKDNWSNGNFEPIGNPEMPFDGVFKGEGYKIKGLDIRGLGAMKNINIYTGYTGRKTAANFTGLFGAMTKNAVISDLVIDSGRFEGASSTGALCGKASGTITGSTVMDNVIVKGDIGTGGVVGEAEKTAVISGVTNRANVYGSNGVGGIAGLMNAGAVITSCTNAGTVETKDYNAGGIVGKPTENIECKIEKCRNEGNIKGTGVNGGIIGSGQKCSIISCSNAGKIEGNGAGGIAGSTDATIEKCTNSGAVSGNFAGGIAAMAGENALIQLCINEEKITGVANVGGIVGENINGIVKNVYNRNEVSGNVRVGGLVGKNTGRVQYGYNASRVGGSVSGSVIGENKGRFKNLIWLEGSSKSGLGESTVKETLWEPCAVTEKELNGEKKVDNGDRTYFMIIDKLNQDNSVKWKYLYEAVAGVKSGDDAGNNISETDVLGGTYLYPVFEL